MNRFLKWAEREYSVKQRMIALVLEGILFMIVVPFFLVAVSSSLDYRIQMPRIVYGLVNPLIGLLCIGVGWLFAVWSIQAQFTLGRGTPAPIMATQKLVVRGPYAYCRNPMSLGTILFYLGIGIWIGSLSAIGLIFLFSALLLTYNKVVEERELAVRFGSEYLEYKRRTPFLIPRFWEGVKRSPN